MNNKDLALKTLMLEFLQEDILTEDENVVAASVDYAKVDKLLLNLPKFQPSESWGDPSSLERKNVERVFNVFRSSGGKQGVKEKLQKLARIQVAGTKITSPKRILKSIMALESLAMIVNGFGESSAGFVFEGFIAALCGGSQVTALREDGTLPITDVSGFSQTQGETVALSLKLLSDKRDNLFINGKKGKPGSATSIHGSFRNMVEGLASVGKVIYLIAYKYGDTPESGTPDDWTPSKIKIGLFEVNNTNLFDVLVAGNQKAKANKIFGALTKDVITQLNQIFAPSAPQDTTQLTEEEEEMMPVDQQEIVPEEEPSRMASEVDKSVLFVVDVLGKKALKKEKLMLDDMKKLYAAALSTQGMGQEAGTILLRACGGYGDFDNSKLQWHISANTYESSLPETALKDALGEIIFSPEAIREAVALHIQNIRGTLIDMLEQLRLVTEETNQYLLTNSRSAARNAGDRAVVHADKYEGKMKEQVANLTQPTEIDEI